MSLGQIRRDLVLDQKLQHFNCSSMFPNGCLFVKKCNLSTSYAAVRKMMTGID